MEARARLAEETLVSALRSIVAALRALKELESPRLVSASGAAGGPERITAMQHLRAALLDIDRAIILHRRSGSLLLDRDDPSPGN